MSGKRPDFNPIENLWDELERILGAGHSHSASLSDLTNALQEESAEIPTGTLLNLVKIPPSGVEAVLATKGGLTSF